MNAYTTQTNTQPSKQKQSQFDSGKCFLAIQERLAAKT